MLDIKVKRVRLTAQLPPTPCTPEMARKMREVAEVLDISVAEVQRSAFSLFLAHYYSKTIADISKSTEEVSEKGA